MRQKIVDFPKIFCYNYSIKGKGYKKMATIVCGNIRCKYLTKSGFCGREFGIFNQFGMCEMWWDKRGQMRGFPLYDLEPEPQEADEHERPQAIFSEDISESDKVEGNDGK